jgi:hypothetical protein
MIGRAQWFYFTRFVEYNAELIPRMKGVQIPWETYIQSRNPRSRPPSPPKILSNPVQLNDIAEARRLMVENEAGGAEPGTSMDAGGMSFGVLVKLISEGRAGEVEGIRNIPDSLNVSLPPGHADARMLHLQNRHYKHDVNHGKSQLPTAPSIAPSPSLYTNTYPRQFLLLLST